MRLRHLVVLVFAGASVAVHTLAACGDANDGAPAPSASPDASTGEPPPGSDAAPSDAAPSDAASPDSGSANDAQRAYQALEGSFVKALRLAFDGFNGASGGTVAPPAAAGDKAGTITVAGTVDQGASSTKSMTLGVTLAGYSDDAATTCETKAQAPAAFALTLADIPTGTLSGTLKGSYELRGNVSGTIVVNVAFAGPIRPNAVDSGKVERTPGATHVTGTVTAGSVTYGVDVMR